MDRSKLTKMQAQKLDRIIAGERVVVSDADLDAFTAATEDDKVDPMMSLASVPNYESVGTLDRYIAFMKAKPVSWRNSDEIRDACLDGIARGVAKLDADPKRHPKLCYVDVAFLDAEGGVVRVAPLAAAFGWVSGRLTSDEEGNDLRTIVAAHVQEHEGPCVECRNNRGHVEPETDTNGEEE